MKIEKLPSGSYRIRQQYKRKRYTVITEYKPTQKEATQLLAAEFDKASHTHAHMTVAAAAEEYITTKEPVLSPSTIRGYRGYCAIFRTGSKLSSYQILTALHCRNLLASFLRPMMQSMLKTCMAF